MHGLGGTRTFQLLGRTSGPTRWRRAFLPLAAPPSSSRLVVACPLCVVRTACKFASRLRPIRRARSDLFTSHDIVHPVPAAAIWQPMAHFLPAAFLTPAESLCTPTRASPATPPRRSCAGELQGSSREPGAPWAPRQHGVPKHEAAHLRAVLRTSPPPAPPPHQP